ncbi:50S ribosomal protein L21 [Candidatus Microgenomates bacterium]|nr:50S ribosomal protein L21 [Candidatus Microgenomates bacterium]
MKYAVIKTSGRQYKICQDEEIVVDKMEGKEGDKVVFDEILLIVDDKKIIIGTPKITKAKVMAEIVKQDRGEKIRVAKFKAKSRYRKVMGFRAYLTRLKIKKISSS